MTKSATQRVSDGAIRAQLPAARARAARRRAQEPRAISARYDARRGRVVVELTNGMGFAFPAAFVPGLEGASPRALAVVEVAAAGEALHWPRLDLDWRVSVLLDALIGARAPRRRAPVRRS